MHFTDNAMKLCCWGCTRTSSKNSEITFLKFPNLSRESSPGVGAFRSYHSVGLQLTEWSCVQCTFSSGLPGPFVITEATAGLQDSFQAEGRWGTYAEVPQLDRDIKTIECCCFNKKPAVTHETEVRHVERERPWVERTRRGKETGQAHINSSRT